MNTATSQKPTFTAPTVTQAMGPQVLKFQLVVNDTYGDSEAAVTTVTVNPVLEKPYAPTNVVATPGNATATVTFTPGLDGGSPVLVYVAHVRVVDRWVPKTVFAGAGTASFTGLTNGAAVHLHGRTA